MWAIKLHTDAEFEGFMSNGAVARTMLQIFKQNTDDTLVFQF
jgi:hypothetical protein